MKTACKSCGKVSNNYLDPEKKIICEVCGKEVAGTDAIKALLQKKGMVRERKLVVYKDTPPPTSKPLDTSRTSLTIPKKGERLAPMDHFNNIRSSSRADPAADLALKKKALETSRNPAKMRARPSDVNDPHSVNAASANRRGMAVPRKERQLNPRQAANHMLAERKGEALKEKYAELNSDKYRVRADKSLLNPNYKEYTIDDGIDETGLKLIDGEFIFTKSDFDDFNNY